MKSIYEEMNNINDEESLTESNLDEPFTTNIDKDILDSLDCSYDAPVTDNFVKCSKSVVPNALYYVSQGENVEFCLGNMKLPYKQISHCWIVHNGEIAQTRVPDPNVKLVTQFSIPRIPNDVEGSKERIKSLVTSI